MQNLVDALVLLNAILLSLCIVRFWGSARSVRNLLYGAFAALGIAMVFTAFRRDDLGDYAATVGYYLLCVVVCAFALQGILSRKPPRD